MIFLKNAGGDVNALDKAEALREEMQSLSRKIDIPVSISVGIAVYDRDGDSFERLYKAADEALYQVKRNGKNNVSFYSVSALAEAPVAPEARESDDADDIETEE